MISDMELLIQHTVSRRCSLKPPVSKGYVYLIQCGEFVKAGIARNLKSRLNSFKTSNPHQVMLVAARRFDDHRLIERQIHKALRAFHHSGEWFKISPSDALSLIKGAGIYF